MNAGKMTVPTDLMERRMGVLFDGLMIVGSFLDRRFEIPIWLLERKRQRTPLFIRLEYDTVPGNALEIEALLPNRHQFIFGLSRHQHKQGITFQIGSDLNSCQQENRFILFQIILAHFLQDLQQILI